MNRIALIGALFVAAALTPALAYANAGTPLMWAGAAHLILGNAVIGIGEGLILAFLFRQRILTCVAIMIVANYFSAWIAAVVLIHAIKPSLNLDLYNTPQWLWCMVAATYFITLLLEWPFVALCLRKCQGWFRKSIWGSLVVQSASYFIIFGWYWAASGTSLYTDMTIVAPSQITAPNDVVLYYISEADGNVYAMNLEQHESEKVSDLGSTSSYDRLLVRKQPIDSSRWDLVARIWPENDEHPAWKTVLPKFASVAVQSRSDKPDDPNNGWANFGEVPSLGKSDWKFETGFWPIEGLRGDNAGDGRIVQFSLETPFAEWAVRNATQLPNGQVVFQLGDNQICILDPDQKAIALLVKGRGPVVTIKE